MIVAPARAPSRQRLVCSEADKAFRPVIPALLIPEIGQDRPAGEQLPVASGLLPQVGNLHRPGPWGRGCPPLFSHEDVDRLPVREMIARALDR